MTDALFYSILAIAVTVGLAAGAFVAGALVWLKRLRQNLSKNVGDALSRQVTHGQKVEEALLVLAKHNRETQAQLASLVQAHARTRADLVTLAKQLEAQRDSRSDTPAPQTRILH